MAPARSASSLRRSWKTTTRRWCQQNIQAGMLDSPKKGGHGKGPRPGKTSKMYILWRGTQRGKWRYRNLSSTQQSPRGLREYDPPTPVKNRQNSVTIINHKKKLHQRNIFTLKIRKKLYFCTLCLKKKIKIKKINKRLDGKRWGKAVSDLLWLEKRNELLYLNWLLVVDDTQVLISLFGKDNFSSISPEEQTNKQKVIIKNK